MKLKTVLIFVIGVVFATQVFAGGIYVYVDDNALKKLNGSTLNDISYHPSYDSSEKLQFFYNTLPDPDTIGTSLSMVGKYVHSPSGFHQYSQTALDGGTLYVRVWDGTPVAKGSYYGKSSANPTTGGLTPKDWPIHELRTDYKADDPYAPTVGNINESLQRSGDDLQLTLVIPVSYSVNGPDGKREIQPGGLSLRVTYPDNTTETKSGSSITLSDTPSGSYTFVPIATNWFGQTEGAPVNYATLGVEGGGAVGPITYNLITGINAISILHDVSFTVDTYPTPVQTVGNLVDAINSVAGANVVTSVGILTDNAIQGAYVTYDQAGNPVFTPSAGFADGGITPLVRGMSMQITVTADVPAVTFRP